MAKVAPLIVIMYLVSSKDIQWSDLKTSSFEECSFETFTHNITGNNWCKYVSETAASTAAGKYVIDFIRVHNSRYI